MHACMETGSDHAGRMPSACCLGSKKTSIKISSNLPGEALAGLCVGHTLHWSPRLCPALLVFCLRSCGWVAGRPSAWHAPVAARLAMPLNPKCRREAMTVGLCPLRRDALGPPDALMAGSPLRRREVQWRPLCPAADQCPSGPQRAHEGPGAGHRWCASQRGGDSARGRAGLHSQFSVPQKRMPPS